MAARKHLSAVPLLVAALFALLPASALAAGKTQTISFTSTPPSNAKVEGATYTVSATATSGLPVSFSSATPGKCSVSGSTVSFIGAGTCTVHDNQAGNNGEWEPAKQVAQSFAVAKGTQTVTFASTPPSKPVVGGAYVPTVHKGVSGEEVLLSVEATSAEVCAVTGTEKGGWTVSFTGAGTCTIDANQPGGANYEPAPLAQQSMIVKRTQTI